MAEVGISVTLHNSIGFLCRSFTRIVLYCSHEEPNRRSGGNDTGLPSSAYITDRVRFCLFAGGIVIHVTGTAKPVIYTPYLLVIAYHCLSLFSRHDIYQQFTLVNHTGQA